MNDLSLISANIVVLANTFNVSIASKDWLQEHVISVEPTDYLSTPVVSAYHTDQIQLLVDQSRLQVICKQVGDDILNECANIVCTYVKKLPDTPYTAIGLNYVWNLMLETDNLVGLPRDQFSSGLHNLADEFTNYSVGLTMVGQRSDAQIRLSIEPSLDLSKPMTIKVNYHYDCTKSDQVANKAKGFLVKSEEAACIAQSVLFGEKRK